MHYSRTVQVTKNNSSIYEVFFATSPEEIYQTELIDFIYKEVIIALKERIKGEVPRFDLDSVEVLKKADLKVREKLFLKKGF